MNCEILWIFDEAVLMNSLMGKIHEKAWWFLKKAKVVQAHVLWVQQSLDPQARQKPQQLQ